MPEAEEGNIVVSRKYRFQLAPASAPQRDESHARGGGVQGHTALKTESHCLQKRALLQRTKGVGSSLTPIQERQDEDTSGRTSNSGRGTSSNERQRGDQRQTRWWDEFMKKPGHTFDEMIRQRVGISGPYARDFDEWRKKQHDIYGKLRRDVYLKWLQESSSLQHQKDFDKELLSHVRSAEKDYGKWHNWVKETGLAPWNIPDHTDRSKHALVFVSKETNQDEFNARLAKYGIQPSQQSIAGHASASPRRMHPDASEHSNAVHGASEKRKPRQRGHGRTSLMQQRASDTDQRRISNNHQQPPESRHSLRKRSGSDESVQSHSHPLEEERSRTPEAEAGMERGRRLAEQDSRPRHRERSPEARARRQQQSHRRDSRQSSLANDFCRRPGATFDRYAHAFLSYRATPATEPHELSRFWDDFLQGHPEYGGRYSRPAFRAFVHAQRERFPRVHAFFGPLAPMVDAAERNVAGWQAMIRQWAMSEAAQVTSSHTSQLGRAKEEPRARRRRRPTLRRRRFGGPSRPTKTIQHGTPKLVRRSDPRQEARPRRLSESSEDGTTSSGSLPQYDAHHGASRQPLDSSAAVSNRVRISQNANNPLGRFWQTFLHQNPQYTDLVQRAGLVDTHMTNARARSARSHRPAYSLHIPSWWQDFLAQPGPFFDQLIQRITSQGPAHTDFRQFQAANPRYHGPVTRASFQAWMGTRPGVAFGPVQHMGFLVSMAERNHARWSEAMAATGTAPTWVPNPAQPGRGAVEILSAQQRETGRARHMQQLRAQSTPLTQAPATPSLDTQRRSLGRRRHSSSRIEEDEPGTQRPRSRRRDLSSVHTQQTPSNKWLAAS